MEEPPQDAHQDQHGKRDADRLVHVEPARAHADGRLRDRDHPQTERDLREQGNPDQPVQDFRGACV
jgi:hypothetical protein